MAGTVGVLVHEFGHAVAARVLGLHPSIELAGFGGLTSWSEKRKLSPREEVSVVAAGPAAAAALGLLVWVFPAGGSGTVALIRHTFLWTTFGWSLLNLLPFLPLDGGRLLMAAFEATGRMVSEGTLRLFSFVVALLAAIGSLRYLYYGNAAIAVWLAGVNLVAAIQAFQLEPLRYAAARLQCAAELIHRGDLRAARREAYAGWKVANEDATRAGTLRVIARCSLCIGDLGDPQEARRALSLMPIDAEVDRLLFAEAMLPAAPSMSLTLARRELRFRPRPHAAHVAASALLRLERLEEALNMLGAVGDPGICDDGAREVLSAAPAAKRFEEVLACAAARPGATAKFFAACAAAGLEGQDEVLNLLDEAAEAGFDDVGRLDSERALDAVRERAEFRSVRARVSRHVVSRRDEFGAHSPASELPAQPTPSGFRTRLPTKWRLVAQWCLLTAAGMIAGRLGYQWIDSRFYSKDAGAWEIASRYAAQGAAQGAALACFQWILLRRYLDRTLVWIPATAAGMVLGTLASTHAYLVVQAFISRSLDPLFTRSVLAAVGVAAVQAIVAVRWGASAHKWLLAGTAATVPALAALEWAIDAETALFRLLGDRQLRATLE